MRVGLLGGAFDPVHAGHIAVARAVQSAIALDAVWFLPSGCHRFKDEVAGFNQRMSWLERALAGERAFLAKDWDKGNGTICYTADLLERLPSDGVEYFFIIGQDNVATLQSWHRFEWLLDNVEFVVVSRRCKSTWQELDYADKLHFVQMDLVDVCSADIRQSPRSFARYLPEVIKDEVVSFYESEKKVNR